MKKGKSISIFSGKFWGGYVDDAREKYQFTWNGKGKALHISQTPSLGTLRPCHEKSKNWDSTENLYIEGDNLEVLKILQRSYHRAIKMIYIVIWSQLTQRQSGSPFEAWMAHTKIA